MSNETYDTLDDPNSEYALNDIRRYFLPPKSVYIDGHHAQQVNFLKVLQFFYSEHYHHITDRYYLNSYTDMGNVLSREGWSKFCDPIVEKYFQKFPLVIDYKNLPAPRVIVPNQQEKFISYGAVLLKTAFAHGFIPRVTLGNAPGNKKIPVLSFETVSQFVPYVLSAAPSLESIENTLLITKNKIEAGSLTLPDFFSRESHGRVSLMIFLAY